LPDKGYRRDHRLRWPLAGEGHRGLAAAAPVDSRCRYL